LIDDHGLVPSRVDSVYRLEGLHDDRFIRDALSGSRNQIELRQGVDQPDGSDDELA